MADRKVILRADADSTIGYGHFMRLLALGELLSAEFEIIFATRNPNRFQMEQLSNLTNEVIDLPDNDTHFDEFLTRLDGREIVVLDNYYFDTGYQRAIKDKGCKLVCIDDLHERHYAADLVINHAPGLDSSVFSIEPGGRLLLGPKYMLVRKEFRDAPPVGEQQIRQFPSHLLLAFGGSDPENLTQQYLEELVSTQLFERVSIITGSGYVYQKQLEEFIKWQPTLEICLYHSISASQMVALIRQSDFALVPASTMLFEMMALQLPTLSGYTVDNQKEIYSGFLERNLIFDGGDLTLIGESIKKAAELKRDEVLALHYRQKAFVGKETSRVFIKEFQQL